MQSECRLLAIHCDWEHWRRHATQFPTVRMLRRCSSLTLFNDEEEEDESFDSDFGTDPGDSGNAAASADERLGATGRVTEWDGADGTFSDDGDEERGMPSTSVGGGELEFSWMEISSYTSLRVAPAPVLSFEEQCRVQKFKGKKVPSLHTATTTKKLLQYLEDPRVHVNEFQQGSACTPIHAFIQQRKLSERDRVEMILALLTSGKPVDVNMPTASGDGNTPLHLAAGLRDEQCIKLLLAFGANPMATNAANMTPHDLTTNFTLKAMLKRSGSVSSETGEDIDNPGSKDDQLGSQCSYCTVLEMEEKFNELLHSSQELNANEALAAMMQKQEVAAWRKTYGNIKPGDIKSGLRILFLDGGGIRGLAQIEMLMEIERRTKQKIVDMFDWIVGTSTGGIVALGLVYGKKELSELRDIYFRRKDKLFGGKLKIPWNTSAMEELTKECFKDQVMSSVSTPKVLISAVDLSSRTLPVVFFNNVDDQEHKSHLFHTPVWRVARATSAAPSIFESLDRMYVDGGVKANNPSEFAMTEIREYYRQRNMDMPDISFVVSVGTGRAEATKKLQYRGDNILAIGSLIDLLICAISDSEEVADKFDSQCCHLGIPHYRLNPKLTENISPTETDTLKLINMLYDTKCYLSEQDEKVLKQITEAFEKFKQIPQLIA